MPNKTVPHLNISVSEELKDRLKFIALKEKRSVTKIVVELVENYVEQKEQEYKINE